MLYFSVDQFFYATALVKKKTISPGKMRIAYKNKLQWNVSIKTVAVFGVCIVYARGRNTALIIFVILMEENY